MNNRIFILVATALMLCACSSDKTGRATVTSVSNNNAFPIQVLDKLPDENRFVIKPIAYQLAAEIADKSSDEKTFSIHLPNNLALIISPTYRESIGHTVDFGENLAFFKNSRGETTPIAIGWAYGDFVKAIVSDKDAKRIYIEESIWDSKPKQIVREHDLKCTKDECAFFTTRDCLFKLENPPTAKDMERRLTELSKVWYKTTTYPALSDVNKEMWDYMRKIFTAALDGRKENIELFLNQERMNKYFFSGPMYNVSLTPYYSGTLRPLLIEYGKECFSDKTIAWPEK